MMNSLGRMGRLGYIGRVMNQSGAPPLPAEWTPFDLGDKLLHWYDTSLLTPGAAVAAIPDRKGFRPMARQSGTGTALSDGWLDVDRTAVFKTSGSLAFDIREIEFHWIGNPTAPVVSTEVTSNIMNAFVTAGNIADSQGLKFTRALRQTNKQVPGMMYASGPASTQLNTVYFDDILWDPGRCYIRLQNTDTSYVMYKNGQIVGTVNTVGQPVTATALSLGTHANYNLVGQHRHAIVTKRLSVREASLLQSWSFLQMAGDNIPEAYRTDIQMGARAILDFAGVQNNGVPFYWLMGQVYSNIESVPGWSFSRASTAYKQTKAGLLSSTAANIARITDRGLQSEEARTNLQIRSSEINDTAWSKSNVTVVANAGIAPDGTLTADQMVETTTATVQHSVSSSLSGTAAVVHTISAYVKPTGRTYVELRGTAGWDFTATYNLTALTGSSAGPTTGITTIQPLDNGWVRVSFSSTVAVSGGTLNTLIRLSNGVSGTYTGDGVSGVLLWGVQVEAGACVTSLIQTAGTTVTRAADNAILTNMLALFGQYRTNTLTQSQVFSGAAWTKFGAQITVNDNVTVAPDGSNTGAQLLISGSGTAVRALYKSVTTGNQQFYTATQVYTQSWYVKMNVGVRYIQMPLASAGFAGNWYSNFDLQTGTVTATVGPITPTIVSVGDGWYRVSVTATANATSSAGDGGYLYAISSGTATFGQAGSFSGTESLYIWGSDFKAGGLSDYIPTTTAAVSVGNPFSFMVQAYLPIFDGVDRWPVTISDSLGGNFTGVRRLPSNAASSRSQALGVQIGSFAGYPNKTGARTIKWAQRIRPNMAADAVDNQMINPAIVLSLTPQNLDRIIFRDPGATASVNGDILIMKVFEDLTDAQLQGQTV